ncbi:hypothetical protein T440DRAFT_475214 [Plenodomus tracheiphilus IPT5]|uniref:Uncharacterized protein n=1 Tax=Plenodomus tracheiphilus IPT5 TaxID=1408161 RepID=A0A6A7BK40_9PLEO|nr:hypothetical protein T440DRAFT_475214 [Plenodomus tracheiphilus IPT5]
MSLVRIKSSASTGLGAIAMPFTERMSYLDSIIHKSIMQTYVNVRSRIIVIYDGAASERTGLCVIRQSEYGHTSITLSRSSVLGPLHLLQSSRAAANFLNFQLVPNKHWEKGDNSRMDRDTAQTKGLHGQQSEKTFTLVKHNDRVITATFI